MSAPKLLACLDDELVVVLGRASPPVRAMVEGLVSDHAMARMLGIDAIHDVVLRHGELVPTATEALPFLLALATSPRYPHASALLSRLAAVLAAVDDPPRSCAGRTPDDPAARGVHALFEGSLRRLLHVARRSTDPEACRTAAAMASHFPSADAESLPVLKALLSGARDPATRAPLLAALERLDDA